MASLDFVSCGKSKLSLDGEVSEYMEDRTEMDDPRVPYILCALPAGSAIYFLTENDPKLWLESQVVVEYVQGIQAVPDI